IEIIILAPMWLVQGDKVWPHAMKVPGTGTLPEVYRADDKLLDRTASVKQLLRTVHVAFVISIGLSASVPFAHAEVPEWCRALPRVEYTTLQRPVSDPWFEVYGSLPRFSLSTN